MSIPILGTSEIYHSSSITCQNQNQIKKRRRAHGNVRAPIHAMKIGFQCPENAPSLSSRDKKNHQHIPPLHHP